MAERSSTALPGRPHIVKAGPDSVQELRGQPDHNDTHSGDANANLKATAAAAMQESDRTCLPQSETTDLVERTRVDSAQNSAESIPQLQSEKLPQNGGSKSPLKIVVSPLQDGIPVRASRDSIANSPTLRKHAIPVEEGTANTLPVVPPSPKREAAASSPTGQSLPSFRQLTGQLGQLTELADAATQQDNRLPPASRHHSHSFSSTTSQSPLVPFFPPYLSSAQTSPPAYHPSGPRSPTATTAESHQYGSPKQYAATAYYTDRRRSSTMTETGPTFPPKIPSLPTTSSSGESYGQASSSTDGYSTSHTTPIDGPIPTEGIQRPILPPPPGMMTAAPLAGFQCDYPGCTALPFQTQYLLSSHGNVHSQWRPHYCPVKGCPRSEGGKGFKRKNEMIRHGLVHNSPGYVCPFCPDREHRYPRPDNLQRHVRVHHVDRDRDDPVLREVLAQRQEGTGKQRRRRTQSSAPDHG